MLHRRKPRGEIVGVLLGCPVHGTAGVRDATVEITHYHGTLHANKRGANTTAGIGGMADDAAVRFVECLSCARIALSGTVIASVGEPDRQRLGVRAENGQLRELDKVRMEWLWACTAFNIRKLILAMRMLRAEGTVTPV